MKSLVEVKDSLDNKLGKIKPQFWEVFGRFITTKTSRKEWDSLRGNFFKKIKIQDLIPSDAVPIFNKFLKILIQNARYGYKEEIKIQKKKGMKKLKFTI